MPALDPLLVCIAAAVLVLVAHGVFALAKRTSGDGEPGPIAEGVATLLCGLALIGPLAVLPFVDTLTEGLILLGTACAVVASALPIVLLRRPSRVTATEQPLIVNRQVVKRSSAVPQGRKYRVVVPAGTDPAEAVRSAITGPIPRIPMTPDRARPVGPVTEPTGKVTGPSNWTAPEPAPAPEPEPAPEAPVPPAIREAQQATKALDEVEDVVLDVKSWLRLDR